MKARLVKDHKSNVLLLCSDGSFSYSSLPLLANFILNFKEIEHFNGQDGSWRDTAVDMALYPGETIAIVTDNLELVIYSGEVFGACFESTMRIAAYVTSEMYAEMHDKSKEIVKVYCREGRIPGAQKVGRAWMIPKDAPYPVQKKNQRPKTCGPRPAEKASK